MNYDSQNPGDHQPGADMPGDIVGARPIRQNSPPCQPLLSRIIDTKATSTAYRLIEEPTRGGIIEYWRILRRCKRTLFVLAVAGMLFGGLISISQKPLYQAHTSLEIEEAAPDPSNMKVAERSSDAGATAVSDMPTQIKILQSESLIERALEKLREKGGASQPKERASTGLLELLHFSKATTADRKKSELAKARANLTVRSDGQTRILDVAYDSTDPKHAADFANALASEFIEQNIEMRWNVSQRTAEWLSHELDEMRGKLEHSENALQDYATKSGLMFTSDKGSVSNDKLRQLQTALANQEMERIAKESLYESAIAGGPGINHDMLNDPAAREYRSKITDLMRQRADMATMYTPDYAKVKQVDAQIASLQDALEGERKAIEGHARSEYEEAVRRERLLAANYATQGRLVNREAEKAIQYNILKREVDSNQQLYEAMLQRTKLVSAASALRTTNVRILDMAKVPTAPYKPKPAVNAVLGSFSCLLLGVVVIIARDRANHTLQDRGDINTYLNLPELGVIPQASRNWRLRGGSDDSAIAECFRGALTSILFSGRYGPPCQVLVLTSWSPGEGKSTTVSNLGLALAEIGRRVLIIDGDMRKPNLHRIQELHNKVGLADLLAGSEPVTKQVAVAAVQRTTIPALSVITSGPPPSNPSTLLYSQRAKDLLDVLRKDYDTILIDTPPMQTISDARLFGAMADAVILVVRASSTSRDAARAAKQRFVDDGTNVLGAILNCWNSRYAGTRYDYTYSSRKLRAPDL
jgi:succinoglycan biosynthesis transport protein ExoP